MEIWMNGMHLHLAEKSRTARFQKWLQDHPTVTLQMVADHTDRNLKTVQMWALGRPKEIPILALRFLEATSTSLLLLSVAREVERRAGWDR
jgi:hypothetical protein